MSGSFTLLALISGYVLGCSLSCGGVEDAFVSRRVLRVHLSEDVSIVNSIDL